MTKSPIRSDFKLGFLGGGQLARMSSCEAFDLGIQIAVFATAKDTEPVEFMTPHVTRSSFDNLEDMVAFAKSCDVVTLENEFIDSDLLMKMRDQSGTPLYPSPETFKLIENKKIEKGSFENAGIPVTPYAVVVNKEDLAAFGEKHGWPYLLKSSKGGYDGYGNETVTDMDNAFKAFESLGGTQGREILAEAFVNFRKELAVQVARNDHGTMVYPCCETIQENHICVAVLSPAAIDPKLQKKAQELAIAATEAIDGKGIYAYEFFLTEDNEILLNESAPRPHNSGHYTIEGCATSQFGNHVRAVLDLPLGSTELRKPAVALINLLGTKHRRPAQIDHYEEIMKTPDAHLHFYGKLQSKIGRKMGHMTLLGEDLDETYELAQKLTKNIEI